jgi:peptidylprolyl isomerase
MRRLAVIPAVLSLSVFGLTACGSKESPDSGRVTVTGKFGSAPKVTYTGTPLESTKTSTKVLQAGDGDTIKEGDVVTLEYYIGNGYNGKKAVSSFDADVPASMLTIKAGSVLGAFSKGVIGQKVGSRVEVVADPKDGWGPAGGNDQLGIGNADTTVFVIDIVGRVLDAPAGAAQTLPAWAPKVVDGKPTPTLDWKGVPANVGSKLHTLYVTKGDGPKITKGNQVAMRYYGQVWGGKIASFDNNYSAPFPGIMDPQSQQYGPFTIPGQLIKGWNEGLIGVPVGSRVLLVIPPADGYGAKGSGDKIPGNSTLAFVIDVLGVA